MSLSNAAGDTLFSDMLLGQVRHLDPVAVKVECSCQNPWLPVFISKVTENKRHRFGVNILTDVSSRVLSSN